MIVYCLTHAQRLFVPIPNLSHMARSEWTHTTLHQRPTTAVIMDTGCTVSGTEHAWTQVYGMESHQSVARVRDHSIFFVPASHN